MGGMTTLLHLQADDPGTYEGRSFNFSGDGFSDMHFLVHAVPSDQFGAWAAKTKGTGPTLDADSYGDLEKPSQKVVPFTYGAVTPGMFGTILSAGSGVPVGLCHTVELN
jgi:cytochrome o ubiquinol oxidase subunit 2